VHALRVAGPEDLLADVAQQHVPVMLVVSEQVRHAEHRHVRHEPLERAGRRLDHRQCPTLDLLDGIGFRSELPAAEDLDLHRSARQLRGALAHELHRDVDGMRRRKDVPEFQHGLVRTPAGARRPDGRDQNHYGQQGSNQQPEREKGDRFTVHLSVKGPLGHKIRTEKHVCVVCVCPCMSVASDRGIAAVNGELSVPEPFGSGLFP